jgi:predicted DNA-binding protein with PD1-like motif
LNYRLLEERDGRRTLAVALDIGEEVMSTLSTLARELSLVGSSVSGIGGFQRATLGYFAWDRQEFVKNYVEEQVELLSFQGTIAAGDDGTPTLHAHVVLGRSDASTRGGHLVEGIVRPTLEAIIVESPEHLHRLYDQATGLVLLKP